MKFRIFACVSMLLLFTSPSLSQDFDEPTFDKMAFFGLSSQIKLIKDFCSKNPESLSLIIEAEKAFIQNSPQYLKFKENPPKFSDQVRHEIASEQSRVDSMMKERLTQVPVEPFCEGFAANLQRSNFQTFVDRSRGLSEKIQRQAKNP